MARYVYARRLLQAALLLAACLCLPACGNSKINKANYNRIQEGMSLEDVEGILGKGTRQEGDGSGVAAQFGVHVDPGRGGSGEQYVWESGDSSITVYFRNEKVANKTSKGLE
jgi:hypothetical protein